MTKINSKKINKSQVLSDLVKQLEDETKNLEASFEKEKKASQDAPGAMEAQYDTTKAETGMVADKIGENIIEKQQGIEILKKLELPESPNKVDLGCIAILDSGESMAAYFILPVCGGMNLSMQGSDIGLLTISPDTIVSQALLDKSAGDEISINEKIFKIIKII